MHFFFISAVECGEIGAYFSNIISFRHFSCFSWDFDCLKLGWVLTNLSSVSVCLKLQLLIV